MTDWIDTNPGRVSVARDTTHNQAGFVSVFAGLPDTGAEPMDSLPLEPDGFP